MFFWFVIVSIFTFVFNGCFVVVFGCFSIFVLPFFLACIFWVSTVLLTNNYSSLLCFTNILQWAPRNLILDLLETSGTQKNKNCSL